MREIVRLGFILMIICAVAAAALAATYAQTRPIIVEQQARAMEAALGALLPEADRFELEQEEEETGKAFYIGYQGDQIVGAAAVFVQGGYGGDIRMMLGVDDEGRITGLRIMEHGETPGLGARITESWFTDQFVNKDVDAPLTLGQDLEGITGATISSRSVAGGVKMVAAEIQKLIPKEQ